MAKKKPRLLLLPGSWDPASVRCRSAYAFVAAQAAQRGFDCVQVRYPGQGRDSSGQLSYLSAREEALRVCNAIRPSWIVCFSLGCVVGAGLWEVRNTSLLQVEGMVLWGPYLGSFFRQRWSSKKEQDAEARAHRMLGDTMFAPDYFQVHPDIEQMVGKIDCHLRIARGSQDTYNTSDHIAMLYGLHRIEQRGKRTEMVEIAEAGHTADPASTPPSVLSAYADVLFNCIH